MAQHSHEGYLQLLDCEVDVSPVLHVDIVNVLRQRMLAVFLINRNYNYKYASVGVLGDQHGVI